MLSCTLAYGSRADPHNACYEVPFPLTCLVASGGHTSLVSVKQPGHFKVLGETTDDAIGEAFDKAAGLCAARQHARARGLPATHLGACLEALARDGDPLAVPLPLPLSSPR